MLCSAVVRAAMRWAKYFVVRFILYFVFEWIEMSNNNNNKNAYSCISERKAIFETVEIVEKKKRMLTLDPKWNHLECNSMHSRFPYELMFRWWRQWQLPIFQMILPSLCAMHSVMRATGRNWKWYESSLINKETKQLHLVHR